MARYTKSLLMGINGSYMHLHTPNTTRQLQHQHNVIGQNPIQQPNSAASIPQTLSNRKCFLH